MTSLIEEASNREDCGCEHLKEWKRIFDPALDGLVEHLEVTELMANAINQIIDTL